MIQHFPEKVGEEEEELLLGEGLSDAEPPPHHERDAPLVAPERKKFGNIAWYPFQPIDPSLNR